MDWISVQVPAALISGTFTVLVALITYFTALRSATKRAAADFELARQRVATDIELAVNRADVDTKLANLRGDIERDLYEHKLSLDLAQLDKKFFVEQRTTLCLEAINTAARLASEHDPKEWEKARLNFWRLYWGPLSIVEDLVIEDRMVALGKLIPLEPVASPNLPMTSLQAPAYMLARAARGLVLGSYGIRMPEPADTRVQSGLTP